MVVNFEIPGTVPDSAKDRVGEDLTLSSIGLAR
jgi:hypothetical protein